MLAEFEASKAAWEEREAKLKGELQALTELLGQTAAETGGIEQQLKTLEKRTRESVGGEGGGRGATPMLSRERSVLEEVTMTLTSRDGGGGSPARESQNPGRPDSD
eukprot:1279467-Rhodomonas_salina.2